MYKSGVGVGRYKSVEGRLGEQECFEALKEHLLRSCIREPLKLPDMVRFSSFENLLCQVDFSALPLTCVADLCIR